jgi:hypothetical protein
MCLLLCPLCIHHASIIAPIIYHCYTHHTSVVTPIVCLLLHLLYIHYCACHYIHHVPVVVSVITSIISNLRNGCLGLQFTPIEGQDLLLLLTYISQMMTNREVVGLP